MMYKSVALLGIFFFASCNNQGQSSTEVNADTIGNTRTVIVKDSIPAGCYAQIAQRDTALLQFESKDSTINGTLSYKIYEKDRNDGTVQGDVEGNILTGWYIFKSEGVVSVRQVAWKINGEELWPGMGQVIEKNDTARFVQPDKLQYDSLSPFKKVPCII